jgi:hypothetical protein
MTPEEELNVDSTSRRIIQTRMANLLGMEPHRVSSQAASSGDAL